MAKILTPDEPQFFQRTSQLITPDLPGERILAPKGNLVVIRAVEGFNGLIREVMQKAYDRAEREPGQMVVTAHRGHVQLNVTGKGKSPQLVWMKKFTDLEGKEVSANQMARWLAEVNKEKLSSQSDVLDYAVEHFDGKDLQAEDSPLRIMTNNEELLTQRKSKISFDPQGGTASNSVGVAQLTDKVAVVRDREQLVAAIQTIAEAEGLTVERLLSEEHVMKAMQRHKELRQIIAQLAQLDG